MFSSATRVSLLIMIIVLCGINVFALYFYPGEIFKEVFAVFSNILIAVTSFFFGKSTGGENLDNNKKEPQESVDILSK